MSGWYCQVARIEKIEKHPGADLLSIATVLGDYPVVIKTGQFEVGQLVSYFSIDTVVPSVNAYYFMCPKNYEKYEEDGQIKQRQLGPKYDVDKVPEKYRIIKAKRIRDIYSMGLIVAAPEGFNEGDSVVEHFGLKKWEEPEDDESQITVRKNRGTNAASPPKEWSIPYYDVEGFRKYHNSFIQGEDLVVSEKIHGSNFSACFDGEKLWIKSRNFYKKDDPDDAWQDAAIRYDLVNKLQKFPGLAFFGELVGNNKGFRYDAEIVNGALHTKLHFFDVYDTKTCRYLDYEDAKAKILEAGLSPVPELYKGPYLGKEHLYKLADGKSMLNPKHIREGCVVKTLKYRYDEKLQSRLILKIIGQEYSLQK